MMPPRQPSVSGRLPHGFGSSSSFGFSFFVSGLTYRTWLSRFHGIGLLQARRICGPVTLLESAHVVCGRQYPNARTLRSPLISGSKSARSRKDAVYPQKTTPFSPPRSPKAPRQGWWFDSFCSQAGDWPGHPCRGCLTPGQADFASLRPKLLTSSLASALALSSV